MDDDNGILIILRHNLCVVSSYPRNIPSPVDDSCASCKRERQIQHFARKEFLWKKFEERSSI
jgi:hypothetical protein